MRSSFFSVSSTRLPFRACVSFQSASVSVWLMAMARDGWARFRQLVTGFSRQSHLLTDPCRQFWHPDARREVRKQEGPLAPHLAGIAVHDLKRGAHIRSEIDFVDYQQIRARDSRTALARNLVSGRDVDDVDGDIHQLRAERSRQIVSAALNKNQFEARMSPLQ